MSTRNNEPLSPPNSEEDSIPAPLSDLDTYDDTPLSDLDTEDDEVAINAKCACDDVGRGGVMGDMIIKRVSIVIVPHVTIIVQLITW